MTPMNAPTQPNLAVVIERLDNLSRMIEDLDKKIECLTKDQNNFMVQYTAAHVKLDAKVDKAVERTEEAHRRIDKLAAGAWALALPIILGALAFLWGVVTHTITIGARP